MLLTTVATLAIGRAGAVNAALLATAILANKYPPFKEALHRFRTNQTQAVLDNPDPLFAEYRRSINHLLRTARS